MHMRRSVWGGGLGSQLPIIERNMLQPMIPQHELTIPQDHAHAPRDTVASIEHIQNVASRVIGARDAGHDGYDAYGGHVGYDGYDESHGYGGCGG